MAKAFFKANPDRSGWAGRKVAAAMVSNDFTPFGLFAL